MILKTYHELVPTTSLLTVEENGITFKADPNPHDTGSQAQEVPGACQWQDAFGKLSQDLA
jgi:hypothetical protein